MNSSKSGKKPPLIMDMVTVNDKGQVVIPSSARTTIDLKSGDKLLVMIHPSHEGVVLIKPDGLETYATSMLEQLNTAKQNQAK
jgi:AbrB family looped-hinge helix DNA binding protein